MCSWHPISLVLKVCSTYTLPHSYRMQYTLDVLRPRLLLISLNVIEVFFYRDSLLVVLHVKCWYRSQATPIGFSDVVSGLFLVCRAY